MATFDAVLTDLATDKLADAWIGGLALDALDTGSFKFGEGGWTLISGLRTPNEPADFTGLTTSVDAGENPGSYPADSVFVFSKAFAPGDVVKVVLPSGDTAIECTCFLDFGEANDDGLGNDPEFYELGVLDAAGDMVGYATFPREVKNATRQITHIVRFIVRRAAE